MLANIVLNELDWWIASQWDEMVGHMKHPCKVTYYPNGAEKKCNSYTALKKSNLKEMRIVRYADDFKIFCRTKEDAEKTYYAVKDWLWKRLKLEVSDEKSKVTNLRIDVNSMLWLMRHPIPTESVRYNDNRVSLYAGQDGKCAITGKKLDVQTCICYRKTNNCKKGNDSYQNLLLLSLQGLAIVSSEDMMSVAALVKEYSLNAKVITKVNKLRATAGLPLLAAK